MTLLIYIPYKERVEDGGGGGGENGGVFLEKKKKGKKFKKKKNHHPAHIIEEARTQRIHRYLYHVFHLNRVTVILGMMITGEC